MFRPHSVVAQTVLWLVAFTPGCADRATVPQHSPANAGPSKDPRPRAETPAAAIETARGAVPQPSPADAGTASDPPPPTGTPALEVKHQKDIVGLEEPQSLLDVTTAADRASGSGSGVSRTCAQFASWVYVVAQDPNDIGPFDVRARPRAGMSAHDACLKTDGFVHIGGDAGVEDAVGLVGDILVARDEDPDEVDGLEFFDLRTGHRLARVNREDGVPVVLLPSPPDSVTVRGSFYLGGCAPQDNEESCWKKLLQDNHVPDTLHLRRPRCDIQKGGVREYFVSAHIDDIRHPAIVYESGVTGCGEDP